MMPMTYLVFAQAGSRSNEDNDDWIVCAYETVELATLHCRKAQARADRLYRANKIYVATRLDTYPIAKPAKWLDDFGDPRDGANPYDPGMRFNNYERVGYSVLAVPVRTAVGKDWPL